jgi:hypothetical protein
VGIWRAGGISEENLFVKAVVKLEESLKHLHVNIADEAGHKIATS